MGAVNAGQSAARSQTAEILEEGRYGTVCRTTLPIGLRVVTEAMPGARSMSVGVFAGVGSRDEPELQAGASHFLEHVLFKGTRRRSAWEISSAIEAVGGDTNAYTTKEYTCFYARVLAADAPLAVDVMCDLVFSSLLAPAEIELERGVICEEIAMHDDDPAESVHDVFASAAFGEHPLGRSITGSTDSVAGLTRDTILDFYRRHYGAD